MFDKTLVRRNKLTINLKQTKYLPFSSYDLGLPHMNSSKIDSGLTSEMEYTYKSVSYQAEMFNYQIQVSERIPRPIRPK